MSPQFYLAHFYIDCSRNLIINQNCDQDDAEQKLPPKTIEVLYYLASRQGDVITVDELLNHVWPDTVVSTNSLQRCIAQLRKAFDDNSKQQTFIKTHAKRGYSLEITVIDKQSPQKQENQQSTIDEKLPPQGPTHSPHQNNLSENIPPQSQLAILSKPAMVGLICFFILITAALYLMSEQKNTWQYDKLIPLTSHDKKETNPLFSPDDKYITFHRYDGMCANNIWAKDLSTEREYQLTQSTGYYGRHTFAEQGKKVAFMAKDSCGPKVKQRACWSLMTIDFQRALNAPQVPTTVASCEDGKLNSPVWIANQAIAVLRTKNGKTHIAKYLPEAPEAIDIFSPEDLTLYHLIQTENRQQIAALAFDSNNQQHLIWLDTTGKVIEQFAIVFPENLTKVWLLDPRYDHQEQQFIFHVGHSLYALDFQGQISKLSTLTFNHISGIQRANHTNRLTASQGYVDADIALINVEQMTNQPPLFPSELNQTLLPYPSVSRSTFYEQYGQFQPNGQAIAFLSDRTGQQQLWLQNGENELTKLTDFNRHLVLSNIKWSPEGSSLVLSKDGTLIQVFLDKTQKVIPLDFPVIEVYQWTEHQQLLLKARMEGKLRLIKLNLTDLKSTVLLEQNVLWAQLAANGVLYYLDLQQQIWQLHMTGASPIQALSQQITGSMFLLKNHDIIGINGQDELWQYHTQSGDISRLTTVAPQFTKLSDIKDNLVLGTQIASSRKDIVLLEQAPKR